MILGPTVIILAGVFGSVALLVYSIAGQRPAGIKLGRMSYAVMTALVTFAAVYLMYLFLTYRFEFQYVFAYSSLSLPLEYTISSFWGGQEGTFLLWLFFGVLLGWTVIARARHYERWAMAFYIFVQIFLIVVLAVRSPFAPTGFEVTDGRGLNPLLQNPWMVIHPPIVFLGFAALAIPFAYAMAALATREYVSYPQRVLPWVGLGVITLGAGIFLGGYWAYKTLGWGGYWGWDPVENSSLIPWVVALALLHGLLVQRRQNKLVRTNLLLAILALLLVVYGTFLTRSGVLADFSVHSFTDLGINAYLVGFMLLLAVGCVGLLLWRARSISADRLDPNPTSRESGLTLGLLVLLAIALLVLLGTSAPLLTRVFGDPANVTLAYYRSISIPAGIALLLLLVLVPFTRAGKTPAEELIKQTVWPVAGASAVTILVILAANLQFYDLVLVFLGLWVVGVSIYKVIRMPRLSLLRAAGPIAHLGFAVMVLGIVASSNYTSTQRVNLQTGIPETVMGYDITYMSRVDSARVEDSYLNLEVTAEGRTQSIRPKMYFSEYTKSVMRNPHVIEGLTEDVYFAPLELQTIEEPGGNTRLELAQGQTAVSGDYTITFEGYEMGDHEANQIVVGARLTVAGLDDTVNVTPQYISGPGDQVSSPVQTIPGSELAVSLERIMVESRSVLLAISDPALADSPGKELLSLEISRKPLISLVWLGIALVTVGSVLSFFRRWLQLKQPVPETSSPPTLIK